MFAAKFLHGFRFCEPNKPQTLAILIVAVFLFSATSGCGDGRPSRVPVSGKVMIDGKPVMFGSLQFLPQNGQGRPSSASIRPDGTFSVCTFDERDGCPLGTFDVLINATENLNDTQLRYNVPKKYGDRRTSGITKTIEGPTDSMLIELTWDGTPGPIVERVN
jgi:hypothetical protein